MKREPVYDRTSDSAPLDWLADEAATFLYDVEADPSESMDVSAANPDIVDELSKRLVDVHAHAAEPLYCAPTRDEDAKARSAFAANGNRLGPWAPLSTDRSHCDDDGEDREALLAEACASGRMLESSCARALAAALGVAGAGRYDALVSCSTMFWMGFPGDADDEPLGALDEACDWAAFEEAGGCFELAFPVVFDEDDDDGCGDGWWFGSGLVIYSCGPLRSITCLLYTSPSPRDRG